MSDLIPVTQSIQLTPAEQNVVDTQHMARHVKGCFVALGGLLKLNKDNAWWSQAGFEAWRDYVEQLGIGDYTMATRLIKVYEIVTSQYISEEDVHEIGMTKMFLLLPMAKQGKLPLEIIDLAKNCTNRDLREKLGLKVTRNDGAHSVTCSRCGAEITGAKWVEKHEPENS